MSKYDLENLMTDIAAELQAQLPTQIAAVEAEKIAAGDGIVGGLPSIPNAAYYFQTWTDKILNSPVSIYYGLESVGTLDQGAGLSADVPKIFIEVVIVDSGQKNDAVKRILRYTRAIKEVMQAYSSKNSFIEKTKIETVRPISLKLDLDTSEEIKVGGVSLVTTIV